MTNEQEIDKVEKEAEKSDKLFTEIFVASGISLEVAKKIAAVLTDLSLLANMMAAMGIPVQKMRNMMATEFQNFVNKDEDVKAELEKVFKKPDGLALFDRAIKAQSLKSLKEEVAKLEAELAQPLVVGSATLTEGSDAAVVEPRPTLH